MSPGQPPPPPGGMPAPDEGRGSRLLGAGIAMTLRIGTAATMAVVAVGYLLALLAGDRNGSSGPALDLLTGATGRALIGIGLFGLTLLPPAVLVVAAIGFHLRGERRMRSVAIIVAGLLFATLLLAAVLARLG